MLLPLLAAGVDLARATAACGTQAQTCLEAAGRGWLGPVAALLVVAYAAGAGLLLARAAGGRRAGFLRAWAFGTSALAATAAGQELLARALGDGAQLGAAPLITLAVCIGGGAVLAFALRAVSDAAELVAGLAPQSPRALTSALWAFIAAKPPAAPAVVFVDAARRGRAPPAG